MGADTWIAFFCVSSAILCGLCLTGAIFVALAARHERESLLRKLRSCESQIKSTLDSVDELREIVQEIANSQKMQRVRRATKHAAGSMGEPDPKADPEGWRAWMNSKLRTGVVN
jgi:hypothetical protein